MKKVFTDVFSSFFAHPMSELLAHLLPLRDELALGEVVLL